MVVQTCSHGSHTRTHAHLGDGGLEPPTLHLWLTHSIGSGYRASHCPLQAWEGAGGVGAPGLRSGTPGSRPRAPRRGGGGAKAASG